MHKIISALIISISLALSGCTSVCPSVGQTGGLGLNQAGWTGLTGLGIIGVQGALCGAGLMVDKLQEMEQAPAKPIEGAELYKTRNELESELNSLEGNTPETVEQRFALKREIAQINALIEKVEKKNSPDYQLASDSER